jgi:hypothetical protein
MLPLPQRLKAALVLDALRGAEAPLFHGSAGGWFIRTLVSFSASSELAPFPVVPNARAFPQTVKVEGTAAR